MTTDICAPYRLILARTPDQTASLQAFIREVYQREFSAQIPHFLPLLAGLYQADGKLVAACGFNPAHEQPLYLEHYLAEPVEALLQTRLGQTIPRGTVMEVGNLASKGIGTGRLMFAALCQLLSQNGYDWVVFTGTAKLRNSLAHLSFDLIELAQASAEQVGSDANAWGDYYRHQPKVMVGNLARGRQLLASNSMLLSLFQPMPRLYMTAEKRMAS